MPTALFVYGTLKRTPHGRRHELLKDASLVGVASMSGRLYDLGSYPGAVRAPKDRGRVFGEVYELPPSAANRMLRELDGYEGSEFERKRAYVTLRDGKRRAAWTYVLRERPRTARPVDSGRYARRRGAA